MPVYPSDIILIQPETEKELVGSWAIRKRNFPDELHCDVPEKTLVLSLTGRDCALNCAHCGGHYLKGMTQPEELLEALSGGRYTSCLVSGGCASSGAVDGENKAHMIANLKQRNLRINMHVGLMSPEELQLVAPLADRISFDFVTDDTTIEEVFGLHRTSQDYIKTYNLLRKLGTPVLPHICIGLKGGQVIGEYGALEKLAELGADGLVFIVLIPTPGTRYQDKTPPPLDEVAQLLIRARTLFPDIPLHLGCMRPKGRYRRELDCLAVRCGLNKIVNPTPPSLKLARSMGLTLRHGKECCAL
ncbi:MAG: radical SAM protein [Dethiosulfovibrio peptidovorans]|nr:MAG: radical SAM protein [Dethiosulfovibrio peptidovorans]